MLKGDNITKENVFKLIDSTRVTTGRTRIDKALRLAHSDLFSTKGGSQPGRPKVSSHLIHSLLLIIINIPG